MLKALIDKRSIMSRVRAIATQICESDANTLCPVLNGALPFFNDLMFAMPTNRAWNIKPIVAMSRTPSGERITGSPLVFLHPDLHMSDKIWIIEDIIDTGSTIRAIKRRLFEYGCQDLSSTALIRRKSERTNETATLIGFNTDNPGWLVGYGMDWMGMYRNEPNISVLIKPAAEVPKI